MALELDEVHKQILKENEERIHELDGQILALQQEKQRRIGVIAGLQELVKRAVEAQEPEETKPAPSKKPAPKKKTARRQSLKS
jgi:hypothetical protein